MSISHVLCLTKENLEKADDTLKELYSLLTDIEDDLHNEHQHELLDSYTFRLNLSSLQYVVDGKLLACIRASAMHKANGYRSFEKFCKDKLNMNRFAVNRTIHAATVAEWLMMGGFQSHQLPRNISQAYALKDIMLTAPGDFEAQIDHLRSIWTEFTSIYPGHEITAKKIKNYIYPPTSQDVEDLIEDVPIRPKDIDTLYKVAIKLKMSVSDVVSCLLQTVEYFAQFTFYMLNKKSKNYRLN